MMRINVLLAIIALACALTAVSNNHHARKLFVELEREQAKARELEVEWGQILIEQRTWAGLDRIDKNAKEKLGMILPHPDQVVSLDTTP